MWVILTDADEGNKIDVNLDHSCMIVPVDEKTCRDLNMPTDRIGMSIISFTHGPYIVVKETQAHIHELIYDWEKRA